MSDQTEREARYAEAIDYYVARCRDLEVLAGDAQGEAHAAQERLRAVEALADEWADNDYRELRRAAGHLREALASPVESGADAGGAK